MNRKPKGMLGCTGNFPTTAMLSCVIGLSYEKCLE